MREGGHQAFGRIDPLPSRLITPAAQFAHDEQDIIFRIVDQENGEWFWRILPDGSVDENEPKVSEWKGPYHNVRMCLEMMRRINTSEERGEQ